MISQNLFEKAFIDNIVQQIGPRVSVTLTNNRKSIISVRRAGFRIEVRVARFFALAQAPVWRDITRFINGETTSTPKSITSFAATQSLPEATVKKALSRLKPQGKTYNLKKIAFDVVLQYFSETMKLNITWGGASRGRRRGKNNIIQLGSYDRDLDIVRIHPVLDSKTVPIEYVALVVYHEALHKWMNDEKKHVKGEWSHTSRFRMLEKLFHNYDDLIRWEKDNMTHLVKMRRKLAIK